MKIITILSQILLLTTSFTCADSSKKNSPATIAPNNFPANGFAVVELFTSEGCSSCPPADNTVAKILKEYGDHVYVLGYHVDYWDNLGWKDIFSNASYTKLQKEYAGAFKLQSIYTPQVVINGSEQFVGSNEQKIKAAIEKDLKESSNTTLQVEAKKNADNVNVSYKTNTPGNDIHIILIQSNAENKIQRGENTGATLHHVNVVRDMKIVTAANGSVVLKLPGNLSSNDCRVIAFMQQSDKKIIAATEVNIQ